MLKRIRGTYAILTCIVLLFSTTMITSAQDASKEENSIRMTINIVENSTHQNDAFTQGILWHQGMIYESTGLYGESTLREVFPNGTVNRSVDLPANMFGEGLALVGEQLIQLTWKENIALIWNISDFTQSGNFSYEGEGWGLCNDGSNLIMSNGSSQLQIRNKNDFSVIRTIDVTLDGEAIDNLNELECNSTHVWANVWKTDDLVRINSSSGIVDRVVNASSLGGDEMGGDMNGIAIDSEGKMWLTGKNWPKIFQVELEIISEETDSNGNIDENANGDNDAGQVSGSQSCTGDECNYDAPFSIYMLQGGVVLVALSCAAIGIFKFWRALPTDEKEPLSQGNVFEDDE